jgi:hypothetical protein
MTKHIEVGELISGIPLKDMTRSEKLRHWAKLIRQCPHSLHLMHGLEFMSPTQLSTYSIKHLPPHTALGIAAADPVLQAQGLTAEINLSGAMRFFELTLHETHAFSCDCGGDISNIEQARRIENLAR